MVGAPLYPDTEIEWLLDRIISGENATSIRAKFEEVFGRPLRKNQIRYIKNKYGKDPRFNSPLINRRPKRNTRARSTRNGGTKKNYREDSDNDAMAVLGDLKENNQRDGNAGRENVEKEDENQGANREDDHGKGKDDSELDFNSLPTNSTAQRNQKESDTGVTDPSPHPPLNPLGTEPRRDGFATATDFQASAAGFLPTHAWIMNDVFGTSSGYGQPANWASHSLDWNFNNSSPSPMLPPTLEYSSHWPNQTSQLFHQSVNDRAYNALPNPNNLLSCYPLPVSQEATLPYPSQAGFQGFPALGAAQQGSGLGFPLPQSHGLSGLTNTNPLLGPQHPNLVVSPELVVPSPQQRHHHQSIPSIQTVIDTMGHNPVPQATQQQQLEDLPTQDTSSSAWNDSQWTSPSFGAEESPIPAAQPVWQSAFTPMLYELPASDLPLQLSPVLTQHLCTEPSANCHLGTIYHPPNPTSQEPSQIPLENPGNGSAILSSPTPGFQPWLRDSMCQQVSDDLDIAHGYGLKAEVAFLKLRDQSLVSEEGWQQEELLTMIDDKTTGELGLSSVLGYVQTFVNAPVAEDGEIKTEMSLPDGELWG